MIPHSRGFQGRGIRLGYYFNDLRSSLPLIDTVKVILGVNPVFLVSHHHPPKSFPIICCIWHNSDISTYHISNLKYTPYSRTRPHPHLQ